MTSPLLRSWGTLVLATPPLASSHSFSNTCNVYVNVNVLLELKYPDLQYYNSSMLWFKEMGEEEGEGEKER